jgi:hypothetical protein
MIFLVVGLGGDLLPLTQYVAKGQYVLVQPFGSNRAERGNSSA